MKKPIVLFALLVVLGVAFYAYKTYNKEHTNVAKTEAEVKLTASDLFNAFDNDETSAMTKYADKVIQVSGYIYSKDLGNELEPQLVLEGNGDNGFIRCGFKPTELEKLAILSDSLSVNIKGECKGLNAADELDLLADKDVVLSNCIIIE
ncbi:MAG: OB-fold putative lipoprotein [Bacteroidia bacterium]|nr:OB-fold putative lipoprotein [Bacteroidia bacterium]NNJ54555.1 hypothetical protein [Bacteroidia bacterium]